MTFSKNQVFSSTIKIQSIMQKEVTRYSDQDLVMFRSLIEGKLTKAKEQLERLHQQLIDINENKDKDYDPDEHSGNYVEKEFLQQMAYRQKKHIRDLENALIRIRNKAYGVCSVTGELIDKRRLLAVPTTTKSLAAKMRPVESVKAERPERPIRNNRSVVTSKVLRKAPVVLEAPQSPHPEDRFDTSDDEEENEGEWTFVEIDEHLENTLRA